MKCKKTKFVDKAVKSPPSRGAWIEIIRAPVTTCTYRPSPPPRGGGVGICGRKKTPKTQTCPPPSRGAWIEIRIWYIRRFLSTVAPLAGGVD